MPVAIGDTAPDFELRNQHREKIRLSQFRGERNVVLVFYPFSFTGVCTSELCSLRDDAGDFDNDDVTLLAISCDSVAVQNRFAAEQGYEFSVLSDFWPHGEVAKRYDVFDERVGCPLRGTFVIDREGIVRWSIVNAIPDARDLDDYRKALANLG